MRPIALGGLGPPLAALRVPLEGRQGLRRPRIAKNKIISSTERALLFLPEQLGKCRKNVAMLRLVRCVSSPGLLLANALCHDQLGAERNAAQAAEGLRQLTEGRGGSVLRN